MSEAKPHLGGAYPGGDANTLTYDVFGYLLVKYDLKSVLDIGAGYGHTIKWFAEQQCRVLGIDGDEEAIAKSVMPQEVLMCHDFTVGAPLIKDSFDLCWSAEFLEHVEERFIPNFMPAFGKCRYACVTHAEPGQTGHHHCVVEGTEVLASGINRASRRVYEGKVVTVVTSRGNSLTITPNHPVLTSQGWVLAHKITKGHHLVSRRNRERPVSSSVANNNNRPTPVEQVFASFSEMSESGWLKMPTTAKDFHGDGMHSYVDVVWPNCLLWEKCNPLFHKPPTKPFFEHGNFGSRHFPCDGRSAFRSKTIPVQRHATPPGDSFCLRKPTNHPLSSVAPADFNPSFNKGLANSFFANTKGGSDLMLKHSTFVHSQNPANRENDPQGFAFRPNTKAVINNELSGLSIINMCKHRELVETFAGDVSFDEVVSVESSNYAGFVFNLETHSNWYFSGGVIIHNCNENTSEYWIEMFAKYGLMHDKSETSILRRTDRWKAGWGRRSFLFFINNRLFI